MPLVPVIYEELWRVASNCMRGERPGHLLQTTALVNEAYLRLIGRRRVNVQTRIQFFAVAAQVMRRVLVDYARGRNRIQARRRIAGGVAGWSRPSFRRSYGGAAFDSCGDTIHAALDNLTALDPRKGKVFEMRYFGGMSLEGVADTLSVSTVTVERDWRMAKIWLRREMAPGAQNAT
ncbi:MAG TPA: ECF-type sigma factor [Bryobacteraceae bacterium]|nr:ECF-type sigma factor [Bryobacteraceae bacterium]